MKKLLFLAMAIITLSCSTDEQQEQLDCNCGTIIEKVYFSPPSNFTVFKVKNNCTGEIKQFDFDGNVGVLNGQWCN
jgi:hypothetical protein